MEFQDKKLQELQKELREAEATEEVLLDELQSDKEERSMEEIEKDVDAIDKRKKELQNKIDRRKKILEKLIKREDVQVHEPKDEEEIELEERKAYHQTKEYRNDFYKYLKGELTARELNKMYAEQRAVTIGSSTSAAPAVPEQLYSQIIEDLRQTSVLFNRITKSEIKGHLRMAVENASGNAVPGQEGVAPNNNEPGTREVVFNIYSIKELIQVSFEADQTTIDALERFISKKLTENIAVEVEDQILNGQGAAASPGEMTGILVDTNITNILEKATLTYDDLLDVVAALPTMYHNGAAWVMGRRTFWKNIVGLKDNNNRPLIDNIQDSKNLKLLGYPVIINDYISEFDDTSNDVPFMTFGDLKHYHMNINGYQIAKSEDSSFKEGLIDYRGIMLADGHVTQPKGFVKVQTPAV